MKTIGIIGLGYVGLPLALEFGKTRPVIGFDKDQNRIDELANNIDKTLECSQQEFLEAKFSIFTSCVDDLINCEIFIITVPTPINSVNQPDLLLLKEASKYVGKHLKKGDIVIYESTVYPGATEEVCVPILEKNSELRFNEDFFCGYSPERINPGDKDHRLTSIVKLTSGSTPHIAEEIDKLYKEIIIAGTYLTSSIKVAEAAKVIENTQRDVNIALMNELSMIFKRFEIDTLEVLKAAETKWNFLPFKPGLVGGHCIGVDPYYLTYKAEQMGHKPEIILAGRKLNDGMGKYVSNELVKLMLDNDISLAKSNVLVLGFSFKENCPDIRNTKVIEVVRTLLSHGVSVDVYDPWIDVCEAKEKYDIDCLKELPKSGQYNGIILAVAHNEFLKMGSTSLKALGSNNVVIYDVKGILEINQSNGRL